MAPPAPSGLQIVGAAAAITRTGEPRKIECIAPSMRENAGVFLFAALVPPREILDDLWSVVDSAPDDAETSSAGSGRHRERTRRRLWARDVAPPQRTPLLDMTPVEEVHLTIAKFGNLALNDADRLIEALTRAAAEWSSPRLRFAGYTTLESSDDPSVWVDLSGDMEALDTVGRGVPRVAQGLSLFVDRRIFQPRVRLGGVGPSTTPAELEALLARLEVFETNAWWQTSLTLLTHAERGPGRPSFKTYADIPLGPHVLH